MTYSITMLHTRMGCPDGHSVQFYNKGESYEVGEAISDTLACDFISKGYAVDSKYYATSNASQIIYDMLKPGVL